MLPGRVPDVAANWSPFIPHEKIRDDQVELVLFQQAARLRRCQPFELHARQTEATA